MKEKKIDDVGDEGNARFEEIPDYALGDTPDTMIGEVNFPNSLYRCITIKRGLVAAYEDTANIEDTIVDALVDLRHLADHCGLDFGERDHIAHQHYLLERKGE